MQKGKMEKIEKKIKKHTKIKQCKRIAKKQEQNHKTVQNKGKQCSKMQKCK